MNAIGITLVAALLATPALAQANCEDTRARIEEKIRANGVTDFTLEIVERGSVADADGRVVGNCEGESRDIVYRRGVNAAPAVAESEPAVNEPEPDDGSR